MKITENKNESFTIRLSKLEMQALVSMVRLEYGGGWYEATCDVHDGDKSLADAGQRLIDEIDKTW